MLASEDPEVDPSSAHVRKEDRVVRCRQTVERFERLCLQRYRPRAQPRLRVPDAAIGVGAADIDDPGLAIDVALLESEQLGWV